MEGQNALDLVIVAFPRTTAKDTKVAAVEAVLNSEGSTNSSEFGEEFDPKILLTLFLEKPASSSNQFLRVETRSARFTR